MAQTYAEKFPQLNWSHIEQMNDIARFISLYAFPYRYISVWKGRSGIFPKLLTAIPNPLQTCVHI